MKPTLLYFYPNEASYVEKDLKILNEKFRIIKLCLNISNKWQLPFMIIYQKLICLYHFNAKFIVCQFAGYHSLLPVFMGKILNIKTVIILGGFDCASFPEINYGNFRKKILGWFTAKSIENADIISPVHEKMIYYKYEYENFINKEQGYKAFTKSSKALVKVIHNGFYTDFFKDLNYKRNKNFVTIASYNRDAVFYLKGIDLMEKAALKFKNTLFTVVGVSQKYINKNRPSNLIFIPFVSHEKLREILNENYFYCQLSVSEGFPNSLCEAMLCGCIPLVSNVCSMPDIIDKTGFVIEKRDENLFFNLIERTLELKNLNSLSQNARERVVENFSYENRRKSLLDLLK
ncbi:MAG: glycosyltransferase family 4 protein [Bacteroidia bacterium]|nr:glycosyltransferase family 4 protein [Bacteroidia bacterium]